MREANSAVVIEVREPGSGAAAVAGRAPLAARSAIRSRTASADIDGGRRSTIVAPAGSAGRAGGGAAASNMSAKAKVQARIGSYVVDRRASGKPGRVAGSS